MLKSVISRLGAVSILLMFMQGCATDPVTGKRTMAMSENWEINAGKKYHQQILKQYEVYDDPELQAYVNDIGQKLAKKSHRPDLPFTFTLLDSPQVNAFALPGGFVYITRGIMAYMNKESHLAGVIGHEIGHVTGRHGAERAMQQQLATVASVAVAVGTGSGDLLQASQMLGGALMSGYGRKQELESDRLGAEYIAHNHYDPDDMIDVIGILKDQELFARQRAQEEGRQVQGYHGLFASHPRNDQRLKEVIQAAEKYRDVTKPEPDSGEFMRLSNGMSFGESESQGITRGNKFYHRGLDLYIEFPRGWRVQNTPSVLGAISPDATQAIQMRMDSVAPPVDAMRYLSSKFPEFRDGRRVNTDEDQAAAGVATISDKRTGQQQNLRVSMIARGGQAFIISGLGKNTLPNQNFFDVVESVRRLKPSEQKLAQGRKIKLVTARRGDTIASLADGEPKVGQTIKIIE